MIGRQHMPLPSFLTDIVGWLRAGYPEGVPDVDYIPLFALLGRHLTDEEVKEVADELARAATSSQRGPSTRRSMP